MNKWIAIPVIAVLVIGIVVSGYFLWQQTGKLGEARTEIVALEGTISTLEARVSTPMAELEATVSTLEADLDKANDDIQTQRTINSSLSAELEKVKDPRHFASLQELTDWLHEDDTDTKYVNESFTQKVFILQVRALRDGYLLPAYCADVNSDYWAEYGGNLAYIGDKIYYVVPGGDATWQWAFMDPIPSHPLPLE